MNRSKALDELKRMMGDEEGDLVCSAEHNQLKMLARSKIARDQWFEFYSANEPRVAEAVEVAKAEKLSEADTLKLVLYAILGKRREDGEEVDDVPPDFKPVLAEFDDEEDE